MDEKTFFLGNLKNISEKVLTKPRMNDKIHHVPNGTYALVAQLDRVTDYESVGRGFESLPSHQKKTSTHCVLVFLFCLRDGRGSNRAAAHSAASNQPSGLLLSPRVPTRRNVYRGSCKSKDFMAFLFCKPWVHGCGKSETYLQKIQDGKDGISY